MGLGLKLLLMLLGGKREAASVVTPTPVDSTTPLLAVCKCERGVTPVEAAEDAVVVVANNELPADATVE